MNMDILFILSIGASFIIIKNSRNERNITDSVILIFFKLFHPRIFE